MKASTVGITIAGLVVIGGGVVWALDQSSPGGSSATPAATSSSLTAGQPTSSAVTITYTGSGFSPSTTTVSAGDSITFTNSSSRQIQVNSDLHPAHTDNPDLNVGTLAPGESKNTVLKKTGSFGIHNHLDASMKAKVIVQ